MELPEPTPRRGGRARRRRTVALAAILAVAASLLAACGGDSGKPTLVWYINPDNGGQDKVAQNCSTDAYTIKTQVLPQDANQQRIQLARRLAAHDSGIDIMSIDPPYTAEFANAGYLAPLPQELQDKLKQQSFDGAVDAATWQNQLVVAPFWSNVQVLWYRKSFVQKAGIDMSQPVTWDQIIDAAANNGGKVAVQSNKYEGYVVWINALISGAGGEIATNTEKGEDATIEVDSQAGDDAAEIVHKLAHSSAAPADMSVAQEGQAGATFGSPQGAFMINWTYIFHNYDATQPDVAKDIGYTMYPETVAGEDARPPYGGIGVGVSSFSSHVDEAMQAIECITSPDNQGVNAELTGNMPASAAGYDYAPLKKIYPADLMTLFQQSLDAAAPRTVTPYWSDISGAIQSTWHPPTSVSSATPSKSQTFIQDVLHGKTLL
jgi:multiple sugar transport system substrate-binding protein